MLPSWTNALKTPGKLFPKIFCFINTKFTTEKEKKKRVYQLKSGIKADYDKLIEITEPILLRGPVAFLILCTAEHEPSFSVLLFLL